MMESPGIRSRRSWHGRAYCLSVVAAAALLGVTGTTALAQTDTGKRVLALPTLQWNDTASSWHYAALPNPSQMTPLLGGLHFGMSPEEVGQHLPDRSSALHWDDLPQAKEFPEDVRYVWMPMHVADTLINPVRSCFGNASYVVLLFVNKALFRISWRFLPDQSCPGVREAAEDLYSDFVPIVPSVAISSNYVAGSAQVVDVTDPGAGSLIPVRFQMQGQ